MTPLVPILSLLCAAPPQDWPKPDQRVACGPLTLEVYISRTAQVFHVVDQLSRWDNSCHGQYREHMELSSEDEAALERYAEVRAKRRWGGGLEQTFYAPLGLEQAARAGEKEKQVTREELDVILPVLERFAPRVDELLEEKRAVLEHAFERVDRARLTKAAEELARFTGVKKLEVPVFPLASPVPGGGGMDGGRLRWELGSEDVSFQVLLHELTHGFLQQRDAELRALVDATPGLSMTLLGEGLAYAMAPGLYPDADVGDNLAYNVAKDRTNGEGWRDDGPARFRIYALGLRPLLGTALQEKSTLQAFLPRARDVFLALREVEEAALARAGPPKLAIAGPAGAEVRERLGPRYPLWISSFNHRSPSYRETVDQLASGDLFVLLVAGDDRERIPQEFAWLSPVTSEEIERLLKAGKTVEESGVPRGTYRVVLLAARTTRELRLLVKESALLE